MSLILEALRKSEAERRRGHSPDLYAELPPAARRTTPRSTPWPWLLLAIATLAVAGWAARSFWSPAPAAAAPRPEQALPVVDTADAAPPAPVEWRPAPRVSAPPAATATTAVVATAAAAKAPLSPPSTQAPPTQALPSEPRRMLPPAPTPLATAPAPVVTEPAVALPPPPAVLPPSPAPIAASAPPTPATAPAPAGPPAPSAVLRLADLDAAARQQLPPLKISMHMWGQNEAQRFAIIDGARVTKGDRVGPAVVDDISADGVVLSWNGMQVKLPVR